MNLIFNPDRKRFEFRCGAEERNGANQLGRYLASQAGFSAKWLGRGDTKEMVWMTESPLRARALVDYATPLLRDQIKAAAASAPLPVMTYLNGTFIWSGPIEGELDAKVVNFKDLYPAKMKFRFTRTPSQEIPGWTEADQPVWWTANVDAARHCARFADEPARSALDGAGTLVSLSRAVSHPIVVPCPEGKAYDPHQVVPVAYAKRQYANPYIRGLLIGDPTGIGKAQPLDVMIVTPRGLEPMTRMQVGTTIIGRDGRTYYVTGVYPQGVKPVYRVIFSDGSSTECCDDHLWQTATCDIRLTGKLGKVRSLQYIRMCLTTKSGKRRHFIPMTQAVRFAPLDTPLPLDPYLLGALIGDGGLAHGVMFSTGDAEMVGRIAELLPTGVTLQKQKGDNCDYRITCGKVGGVNVVLNHLRALGLFGKKSESKFLPLPYQLASVDKRIALLQGLLDTDGFASKLNVVQLTSVSRQLVEDLRLLVESLGGIARLTEKKTTGQLAYTLTLALPPEVEPFRLTRKAMRYKPRPKYPAARSIVSVDYVGDKPVQCISTDAPGGLYLTDHFIVTHNTIEAAAVINYFEHMRKILIIVPATLKRNWQRELVGDVDTDRAGWLTRPLTVGIGESGKSIPIPDTDVVIVNFEMLGRDTFTGKQIYDKKTKRMKQEKTTSLRQSLAIRWDLIIVDECQKVTNPVATRSQLTYSMLSRFWLFLSATPFHNRPRELWMVAHHLAPQVFPNRYAFLRRYCAGGGFFDKFGGAQNLSELQNLMRSNFLVRRPKSILNLPPKRRQVIELPANGCKDVVKQELLAWESKESEMDALRLRVELAKASDNPEDYRRAVKALRAGISVAFEEQSKIRLATAMAKVPMAVTHVAELLSEGNKVLLFTHHKEPAYQIAYEFPNETVMITGDQSLKERDQSEQSFNNDEKIRLCIGTIGAAGVGLNLQQSCSLAVFVELDYVPAKVTQAEDRIWRRGSKDAILVQHLVLEGSLDARMAVILVEKQEIYDKALDNPTPEEMQYVLPTEMSTRTARPEDIAKAAEKLTDRDIADVHLLVKSMCGRGAETFAPADLPLGRFLSGQKQLTKKFAALGKRLIYRYRHQPQLATLTEVRRLFKET